MAQNPYTQAFEMQRAMIESGRTAVESGASMTRAMTAAAVDSTATTRSVQRSGVALGRRTAHAVLDAFEQAGTPVGEARQTVDEAYDAVEEAHAEAWDAVDEALDEYERSVEELTDAQREAFVDALEAAEAAGDDAEEAVDEAFEQIEIDEDA
jgi:hypothetical protein